MLATHPSQNQQNLRVCTRGWIVCWCMRNRPECAIPALTHRFVPSRRAGRVPAASGPLRRRCTPRERDQSRQHHHHRRRHRHHHHHRCRKPPSQQCGAAGHGSLRPMRDVLESKIPGGDLLAVDVRLLCRYHYYLCYQLSVEQWVILLLARPLHARFNSSITRFVYAQMH